MFKNCNSISIYLVSCFVLLFTIVVLTTNATILSIKMVSYKWVGMFSPMTLYHLELTTHCFPYAIVVGIQYTKFETLLLTSYVTSLEICRKLGWNPKITHKHCSKLIVVPNSSTKIVNSSHFSTQKMTIFSTFLLEFKRVIGKT
jgi:hypothetical protein